MTEVAFAKQFIALCELKSTTTRDGGFDARSLTSSIVACASAGLPKLTNVHLPRRSDTPENLPRDNSLDQAKLSNIPYTIDFRPVLRSSTDASQNLKNVTLTIDRRQTDVYTLKRQLADALNLPLNQAMRITLLLNRKPVADTKCLTDLTDTPDQRSISFSYLIKPNDTSSSSSSSSSSLSQLQLTTPFWDNLTKFLSNQFPSATPESITQLTRVFRTAWEKHSATHS